MGSNIRQCRPGSSKPITMSTDRRDSAGLTLETITTPAALASAAADWRALWARCPDATPFQSPEWILPWWECFGNGELRVLAFRHDGRLAGLVPLYSDAPGEAGPRILRLLGSGNTDYLDALIEPGLQQPVMRRVFDHLARPRRDWDYCDFLELRPGSALLETEAPAQWIDETLTGSECTGLVLPAGDPDAAIPHAFLKKLRYYRRRATRGAGMRIGQAGAMDFEAAFDALLSLHTARWEERNRPGVLADAAVQRFNRRAGRALLRRGMVRLYTLYLYERPAASCYTLVHRDRAYCYLTGFDPGFGKFSPGQIMLHHAVTEAAREGVRQFDLLRGREEYKDRWHPEIWRNRRRRLRCRALARERHPHPLHPSLKQAHENLQTRPQ